MIYECETGLLKDIYAYWDGDASLGELPLEIGKLREVSDQVLPRRRSHCARQRAVAALATRPGRTPEADFLMHFALGNLLSSEVDQRRPYLLRG